MFTVPQSSLCVAATRTADGREQQQQQTVQIAEPQRHWPTRMHLSHWNPDRANPGTPAPPALACCGKEHPLPLFGSSPHCECKCPIHRHQPLTSNLRPQLPTVRPPTFDCLITDPLPPTSTSVRLHVPRLPTLLSILRDPNSSFSVGHPSSHLSSTLFFASLPLRDLLTHEQPHRHCIRDTPNSKYLAYIQQHTSFIYAASTLDKAMADNAEGTSDAQVTFKVKTGQDSNHVITMPESATVLDLKTKLAGDDFEKVPVERQRLIYSGRVMKNDDSLATYKIKPNNTIHMVKSAASNPAPQPAASPSAPAAPAVPTNMQAGTANNLLAGLTGARYAGHINLPSRETFGADGGVSPYPPNLTIQHPVA